LSTVTDNLLIVAEKAARSALLAIAQGPGRLYNYKHAQIASLGLVGTVVPQIGNGLALCLIGGTV